MSNKRKISEQDEVMKDGMVDVKMEEKQKPYCSPLMTQWPLLFTLERRGVASEDYKDDKMGEGQDHVKTLVKTPVSKNDDKMRDVKVPKTQDKMPVPPSVPETSSGESLASLVEEARRQLEIFTSKSL